jgi:lysophospholipase L1-like esterase
MRPTRRSLTLVSAAVLALTTAAFIGASGSTAAGTPLRLVALGDSLPYNPQDRCPGCVGFPTLFGMAAGKTLDAPVAVANLGQYNSLTSVRLVGQVRTLASMRRAIARADIITLTIGHNDTPWLNEQDLCDGAASSTSDARLIDWSRYTTACSSLLANALRYNIADILRQIKKLRAGKTTLIRVTNFHNDRIGNPSVPRSADAPSKLVVDLFSKAICRAAATARVPCVDVYHAFNGKDGRKFDGPFVAPDTVHFSQRGHDVVARLLAKRGYAPLER